MLRDAEGRHINAYRPTGGEIGPNLPEEMLSGGGSVQTMAAGKYEEALDIYTVDDLLAIDGHSNGYYTLQADLNIGGMEWKPLNIPGSVFDGNGHTVSGMTITDWAGLDAGRGSVGFIGCSADDNTYVRGLRLTGINISLTADAGHIFDKNISSFGDVYSESCYVDGRIRAACAENTPAHGTIAVLSHATDSTAYVDLDARINVSPDYTNSREVMTVYGLDSCVDSESHGDIYIDYGYEDLRFDPEYIAQYNNAGSLLNCVGCTLYGDLTVPNGEYIYVIQNSRDCEYYGDTECSFLEAFLISSSENCRATGNTAFYPVDPHIDFEQDEVAGSGIILWSTDSTVKGAISFNDIPPKNLCVLITECERCSIYGDTSFTGIGNGNWLDGRVGIVSSEDCLIAGNITSNRELCGIEDGFNTPSVRCTIIGNITGNDHVFGIFGEIFSTLNTCYNSIYGDVIAYNGDATGIECGDNNYIEGSVIDYNGGACGIIGGDNNYIGGSIIAYNGGACGLGVASTTNNIECIPDNNYIGGSVIAYNGDAGGGIRAGSGNVISGGVTCSYNGYTATATPSSNEVYVAKCDRCGAIVPVTEYRHPNDLGHCYWALGPCGGKVLVEATYFSGDSTGGGSDPGSEPEPEPPTPPEPPKASYAVRIIDAQTQAPVGGAVVTVDNVTYTADENGVVSLTDAPRTGNLKVEHGGAVIYSAAGFAPIPNQINTVYVNGISLSADDLQLGNPASTVVEGPSVEIFDKKFNLFKLPVDFEFDIFDEISIAYDKDEGIYQVITGLGGGDDDGNIKDADDPDWKKQYEEAKKFYEDLKKEGSKKYVPSAMKKNLVIEGDLSCQALLELKVEDDGLRLLSGGVVLTFEGEVSTSVNLPPPWTVVYVAFGVEGEFLADAKLRIKDDSTLADPKIEAAADIGMSLAPYLGVGLGVRNLLSVEAGLKGELGANLSLPMKSMEKGFSLDLTGQVYFRAAALALEFERTWDFFKLGLYPKVGLASLASIDSMNQFKLIDRSYLAPAGAVTTQAAADTFKSNIYPYGSVKTARLDDGRILMVWLDDDTSRPGLADKTALYYSIYEGGAWSVPAQIENDGTADFDFDLAAFGTTAAIVWQDTEKTFDANKDAEELAKEMAASTSLSFSEFDGYNGNTWSAPISVTKPNGVYEYCPSMVYTWGYWRIAWMRNASGGLIPETDGEGVSVYYSEIDYDGTITEAAPVCENVPYVYGIKSTDDSVIIIKDANGDPATEDYTLTLDGTDIYTTDSPIADLQYDGSIYFIENGGIMEMSASGGGENPRKIIDAPGACGFDIATGTLIYEVQDGYTSNLYASYYMDGGWGNPVPITDFNEKIRSWDAQYDENGEIIISAALADIQVENDEIIDPTRLVCTNAEIREDLAVNYVTVSDNVTPGRMAEFTVNVTNRTMNDIEGLNITLSGESGELYSGTVDDVIPAGESADVTVSVTLPEGFGCQTVTATVSADGLTDSDTSNNSASTLAGQGNLSVEINDYKLKIDGTAEVTVRNTGCGEISGAVLTVTGDNGETLYTEELGTVAGGERRKITVPVDGKYLEDGSGLTAVITGGEGEAYEYDNEASCRVSQTVSIRPAERQIALSPGDTYESKFTVSPEGGAVYYISSDPEVATVDGNGVITAVGGGTATMTAMLTDSDATAKMRVYVRGFAAPKILSAEYGGGKVNVSVDVSGCLLDGETEKLIVAAYAEDDSLIGVSTRDVTASEDNSTFYASIYVPGTTVKPKKVKVMLWSSLTGMRPASLTATAEVTEQ